jgi:hypothetical protein
MKAPENIEKFLKKFYMSEQNSLKSDSERDRKVVEDALSIYRRAINKRQAVAKRKTLRIIVESRMIKLATVAVIVLLLSLFLKTIMTKHSSTEMDTSPNYILSDVQNNKLNLKEMEPCNILPVIPN